MNDNWKHGYKMSGKRAGMVAIGVAAALAAGIGFSVPVQAAKPVRWAVPIAFSSSLKALGDTLPWVVETLKTASAGQIQLKIFEPGKLIPALGVFDAVAEGKVEAGYSWMGYEIAKVPASALFGAVPFGLEPWEFTAWFYYGGGRELLREIYEPQKVVPLLCGTVSPEAAGWFRAEVKSLEQVQGLKIRAAGLGGKVWQKVGATVSVLPGGEIYQALEKGVLDGAEFSLPSVDEQLGFYKIAKVYYLPGWHQPSTSQYLYVNRAVWDGLAGEQQAMIEGMCTAGVTMAIAKAEAVQGPTLKTFEENGVKAISLPDVVLRALEKATGEVMAEESAKDPQFKTVYESQQAFKAAHRPWKTLGYLPRTW